MKSPRINGLYAITPDLENTDDLVGRTQQVLEGGAQLIQYRNKLASDVLLREQARVLLQLCKEYKVPLIINDHLDLTLEIDADGLHVGRDDVSIATARDQLGWNKIVGASCYDNPDLALQAEKEGADYVAFGAFFPSLTKPAAVAVSMDLIEQIKKRIAVPVVGIGGIRLSNARTIIDSGCTAIAVCNDLFHTDNIKEKAVQYARLFA